MLRGCFFVNLCYISLLFELMNYINKIGSAALMGIVAGCASNPKMAAKSWPVVSVPFVAKSGDSGSDYLTPPEAYSSEDEVLGAIEKMRQKIFRAGGDEAEKVAVENCDNGAPGLMCMMEEGMHSMQGLSLYSKALTDCYSGPLMLNGLINPNGSGTLDLECMMKVSPEPEKFEAEHEKKMLECRRDVLACFQKEYRGLSRQQASN
jgi:hypothetical protein